MNGLKIAVSGMRHVKMLFFALCAFAFSLAPIQLAFAAPGYYFAPTNSGTGAYTDIASSGDGTKVIATKWGGLMRGSSDGGQTWGDLSLPGSRNWRSVTMSQDGQVIAGAPCGNTQLQISIDGGATWAARGTNRNWLDVQMSNDGSIMIASATSACIEASATGAATIWRSQDSGASWVQLSVPATNYGAIGISPDGSTLMIGGLTSTYKSVDDGASWQLMPLALPSGNTSNWSQISYSRDGSTVIAMHGFGGVAPAPAAGLFISKDNGDTWALSTTVNRITLPGFAVSGNGQYIVAQNTTSDATHENPKSSVDGGATWSVFDNLPAGSGGWHFAMSDDGSVAYAASSRGGAELVHRANLIFAPSAPRNLVVAPGLNQAQLTWDAPLDNGGSPITDYLVEYSIDDGATWKTFDHAASATTSIMVTGLDGSILHLFRVSAVNVAGAGPSVMPPIEGTPQGGPYNPQQDRLADTGLNIYAVAGVAILLIVASSAVVVMHRPVKAPKGNPE